MRHFPYLALFFIIGIAVYFPIFFAGFAGDDFTQLIRQPHFHTINAAIAVFGKVVVSPTGHTSIFGFFYRPLPFAVYALLYHIFHANPFYFHVVQFILYAIAVYLLYLFLTTFFAQRLSLLLSMVFLIHPANDELAAYIAAFADTLCLFFGMLALVVISKAKRQSILVLCLISFSLLLSLFAKEAGILFVMLIFVFAAYKRVAKRYTVPIIITVAVYLVCRIYASHNPMFSFLPSPLHNLSIQQRVFLSPQISYAFLREIVMPTRDALKPNAFHPTVISSIFPTLVLCFVALASTFVWVWMKSHQKKNAPLLLFFLVCMIIGILPYIQIIPLEVLFAERWLYITEIGVLGVFGIILETFPLKKNRLFILCSILFVILLLLYAGETFFLNVLWHDWQHHFI